MVHWEDILKNNNIRTYYYNNILLSYIGIYYYIINTY